MIESQEVELEDQAWWIKRLGIACLVLTCGIGGLIVDVYVLLGRQEGIGKAEFSRGLDEGTALKNDELNKVFLAGFKAGSGASAGRGTTVTATGPLDLTKLTPAQIQGLRCYIQDRPTTGLP